MPVAAHWPTAHVAAPPSLWLLRTARRAPPAAGRVSRSLTGYPGVPVPPTKPSVSCSSHPPFSAAPAIAKSADASVLLASQHYYSVAGQGPREPC